MLITFACHAPRAPEVGYLLAKNPTSVFEREFSAGTVWVFYTEVADDHVRLALLTEVDTIGLVRGPAAVAGLDQYVNDRPYVANSLTSVALNVAFRTAMSGQCKALPERVAERMAWEVTLPAVACDAGAEAITAVFAPLGYSVTTERLPLDPTFPAWGPSDVYAVRLAGTQTAADLFNHLYVLLPVLDNAKHYYVTESETEKLLDHGGAWLAAHPARALIARRYLRYKRPLITSALGRLRDADAPDAAAVEAALAAAIAEPSEPAEEGAAPAAPASAEPDARAGGARDPGLHAQRLAAVMAAVRAIGATSLADVGCGEGRLLALALAEPGLTRILGLDVSTRALTLAARRLRLDQLPPARRARIAIAQGSLLYRDRRLEGFDALALVEVIEHLDAPRLGAMERVVFEHARPRRVILTTPNREYNTVWASLAQGAFRHEDHRFEWTRAECQAWADRVAATYGYTARRADVGPGDAALGAPSQLVVLDRADQTSVPAVGADA
ncbi:MAG TPA: 3' terminal RNA ribose 2'-O-methyltransferase Hen1 [Ktedonobacterales bacterium]